MTKKRMIVYGLGSLLVLGVGAAIILPNFIGTCARDKRSSVKANMHDFRTMLETYAVDHGGQYPMSLEALKHESQNDGAPYWKEFSNPITGYQGSGKAYGDLQVEPVEGLVVYAPVTPADTQYPTSYRIYGYGKKAQYIQDKGKVFFLSNG